MSESNEAERLRTLADGYNDPPDAPREALWSGIRQGIEERLEQTAKNPDRDGRSRGAGPGGIPRWAWAAAALLVLGVAVGRWTSPSPTGSPSAVAREEVREGSVPGTVPVRQAAYRHLSATESFLAGVRADVRRGEIEPILAPWADRLLTETRLLMDSRVADDPELGPILRDLELVLMQVRQAVRYHGEEGERAREEIELLGQGMDANDMNRRIDAALPRSAGTTGT